MLVAADYPFLDILWTMLIFFAWVIWFWILITVFADIFRRHDIGGGSKVLWSIFVIALPFLGVFIYLLTQNDGMVERNLQKQRAQQGQFDDYVKSVSGGSAAEIEKAKQLLDSGAITQSEFEAIKAKALASPRQLGEGEEPMEEIGPVEYMIVSFPGNRFTGEIAPALAKLVEANTIRIIDLAFVSKDADGAVAGFELSDVDEEVRRGLEALGLEATGLLGEEDLTDAGAELEPNSSAALLLWEDVWAAELADALRQAGGELLAIGRIPHDVVMEAREQLLAAAATTEEA